VASKLDGVIGQALLIRQALWNLALGRAMLLQRAAGPALRYAKGLLRPLNTAAAA